MWIWLGRRWKHQHWSCLKKKESRNSWVNALRLAVWHHCQWDLFAWNTCIRSSSGSLTCFSHLVLCSTSNLSYLNCRLVFPFVFLLSMTSFFAVISGSVMFYPSFRPSCPMLLKWMDLWKSWDLITCSSMVGSRSHVPIFLLLPQNHTIFEQGIIYSVKFPRSFSQRCVLLLLHKIEEFHQSIYCVPFVQMLHEEVVGDMKKVASGVILLLVTHLRHCFLMNPEKSSTLLLQSQAPLQTLFHKLLVTILKTRKLSVALTAEYERIWS